VKNYFFTAACYLAAKMYAKMLILHTCLPLLTAKNAKFAYVSYLANELSPIWREKMLFACVFNAS
jgi:hypothetical protein